jgi:hypothetical protein
MHNVNHARRHRRIQGPQGERGADGRHGALGDIPLAVVSHDPDKPSADLPADLAKPINDAREKMQQDSARLSTRGTRVIAKNSAHYIQIDRPDVVIESVRAVVQQARMVQVPSPPKSN